MKFAVLLATGLNFRVFRASYLFFLLCLASLPAFSSNLKEKAGSVVKLYVTSQGWNIAQPWTKAAIRNQVCTGFAIEAGILTNAHCVTDATFMEVEIPGVANRLEAKRLAISHDVDLALLVFSDAAAAPDLEPIDLGDLPHLRDKVVTIGYPMGGRQVSYTEGVVSRIDVMPYAHSRVTNLMVQTDAAINPGNSGGPVFSDVSGECIGVATQIARGSSIGYFIPKVVIRQFLTDLEDGHIDGTPGLAIPSQVLENPALRAYFKMSKTQTGIRVVSVPKEVPEVQVLKKNDVILRVDGHQVFNDGQVPFRNNGKIGFAYYVSNHQVGDTLTFSVLRQGKVLELPITLSDLAYTLVPIVPQFEKQPAYFEFSGLILRRLEPRYLSKNNIARLRRYTKLMAGDITGLKDVVLISNIYPSGLTKGYAHAEVNKRVVRINGHKILSMADVSKAFAKATDGGFHDIKLDDGHRIVINAAQVAKKAAEIRLRYGIPSTD